MTAFDFETLVDALADAMVVIDGQGTLQYANRATERLFGPVASQDPNSSTFDLVHPDDLEMALVSITSVVDKEVGTPIELRVRSQDGWRLVELIGSPLPDNVLPGGVLLTLRDLTERRRWEVAGDDVDLMRTLIQNGAALTVLLDMHGVVRAVSAAITRHLSIDAEDVIGQALADVVTPECRHVLGAALETAHDRRELSSSERSVSCEVKLVHANGLAVPFQFSIVDLLDDPTVNGFVVTGHDISELHATRLELAHTSTHDALTNLPNRVAIHNYLDDLLTNIDDLRQIAVAFVDLDRFKPVNDLFGHEAGDELLTAIAGRLKGALRTGDFVGRLGGDEFVIIAAVNRLDEALEMASRFEEIIAKPFGLSSGNVQINSSIGVVLANSGSTVESLLTEADAAMYSVKYGRRGSPLGARRSVGERRALAEALSRAVDRDEFVVHYQPIVDLADTRVTGFEALIRWDSPERGLLHPEEFLDIVEELGSDAELGKIVLMTALRDLGVIESRTGLAVDMHVNAAAAQLTDPDFPITVTRALQLFGVEPSRLTIEVSERTILERSTQGPSTPAMSALYELKKVGVRIAADDFGTGYSSLTHLVSLPIDALKIDKSFVGGVLLDDHRRSIVSALIALAQGMNMGVVAEGVEDLAQARIVRELGCTHVQGYLFGQPMPLDEAVALLSVGLTDVRTMRPDMPNEWEHPN